jgi:hypothetical protein
MASKSHLSKGTAPVRTRAPVANRGPFPERMRMEGGGQGLVRSVKKHSSKKKTARKPSARKK